MKTKLFILLILTIATVPVFAETITRDFNVGAGTINPSGVYQEFIVPSRLSVNITVNFRRSGESGIRQDAPIRVELWKPGLGDGLNTDGELADKGGGMAQTRTNLITLNGTGNAFGCSGNPWKVRIRALDDNNSLNDNNTVSGQIVFRFDDSERNVSFVSGEHLLENGSSFITNIGDATGFGQGLLKINATWKTHNITNFNSLLPPVKLKFDLIKPANSIANSQTAYQTGEPNYEPDLYFIFRNTSTTPGQWRLRITNNNPIDVSDLAPRIKFQPRCFK